MSDFSIVTILLAAVLAAGAAGPLWASDYPLTFTDSYGRSITLQEKPERIVSVAPSVTETLFAIGAGDTVAARTAYCDYPPEVEEITSIGTLMNPDIERIIALQPDLIIASDHFKKQVYDRLDRAGLEVAVLYGAADLDGVYRSILDIGLLTGHRERAREIVQSMRRRASEIVSRVEGEPRPEVYYVIDFGAYGDFTAGGNTFIHRLITLAGGKNVAAGLKGWSYSLEQIIRDDPDIVLCSKYGNIPQQLRRAHGYRNLRAVEEGRLYPIDNNRLDRQGPRVVDALEQLARIFHPEQFE
jgi:iron complex transport system substrate-binding protein